MTSKEVVNLIWAVVVIVTMMTAAWYVHNRVKIQKLKLSHPELGELLDFAGQLAVKATNYQAITDKEGDQKLVDATDEVFDQIKRLYPSLPLSKETVRNLVQAAYDKQVAAKDNEPAEQVSVQDKPAAVKPVDPVAPAQPVRPSEPAAKPVEQAPAKAPEPQLLDDLHV